MIERPAVSPWSPNDAMLHLCLFHENPELCHFSHSNEELRPMPPGNKPSGHYDPLTHSNVSHENNNDITMTAAANAVLGISNNQNNNNDNNHNDNDNNDNNSIDNDKKNTETQEFECTCTNDLFANVEQYFQILECVDILRPV